MKEELLDVYIKPTDELHDSGYKYLEIENRNTGRKIIYDVFKTFGAIDIHLDVDKEGVIHLWSDSITIKDNAFLSYFKNELSVYGEFNVNGEGAKARKEYEIL